MGTDPGPNLDPNLRLSCLTVGYPKNLKFTLRNDSDPGEEPAGDEGTRRIR
jgi:hypothetical protein